MIKTHTLFTSIFFMLCSLFSCSKQNKKQIKDCNAYKERFIDFELTNNIDSALVYINKAIECNPTDEYYKFSKVNFLIRQLKYEEALKSLKTLNLENEVSLQLMEVALNMKIGGDSIDFKLDKIYAKINKHDFKSNSSAIAYKIVLDNYFKGSDYALDKIALANANFEDNNSTLLFESLKNNIETYDKNEVVFKLFNFR